MSVRFTIHVICDGCSQTLTSEKQQRGSFWSANQLAIVHHWLVLERGLNYDEHYCPLCADAVNFNRKSQVAPRNWK